MSSLIQPVARQHLKRNPSLVKLSLFCTTLRILNVSNKAIPISVTKLPIQKYWSNSTTNTYFTHHTCGSHRDGGKKGSLSTTVGLALLNHPTRLLLCLNIPSRNVLILRKIGIVFWPPTDTGDIGVLAAQSSVRLWYIPFIAKSCVKFGLHFYWIFIFCNVIADVFWLIVNSLLV